MNFVAIDVETANGLGTMCAIGLVKVENGQITDRLYSLVFTEEDFYWANKNLHGIDKTDVAHAPKFAELKIEDFIGELPLVAHNKSVEIKTLRKSYAEIGRELPFQFLCTLQISKHFLKADAYNLPQLCEDYLNYKFNHHNALEDAEACAKLMIYLCKNHLQITDLSNVAKVEKSLPKKEVQVLEKKDIEIISDRLNEKLFCITNIFPVTQSEIETAILENGGEVSDKVSKEITYLIEGTRDEKYIALGKPESNKTIAAKKIIAKGNNIKIISYDDFLSLIN